MRVVSQLTVFDKRYAKNEELLIDHMRRRSKEVAHEVRVSHSICRLLVALVIVTTRWLRRR